MRYHGKIGFLTESQETAPGVWNEGTIIEKDCKGDVLKSLRQYEGTSDSTNDNLIIKNRLEIVADPFVYSHIGSILYAEVNGTKELSAPEPVSPQPEASIHITSNAAISAVTRLNLLFDTFFLIYFSGNRFSFLRIFRCGSFPSAVYFCSAQQCGSRSSEIFKPFLTEK